MIEPLVKAGKAVVIPPRATRKDPRSYDEHFYRARHLIENFFARLKPCRAIPLATTRPLENFLGQFIWPLPSFGSIDDRP